MAGATTRQSIFQRRSTVSLMGGFGEISARHDKVPTNLTWDEFDPSAIPVSAAPAACRPPGASGATPSRANNAVGYFTPAMGGFFGWAWWRPARTSSGNKYAGLRGGYRAGPLVAAFTASADSTSGDDAAIWSLGGTTISSRSSSGGFYNAVDDVNAGQSNWLLGATLPVGGFRTARLVPGDERRRRASATEEADMFAIGAVYNLSKGPLCTPPTRRSRIPTRRSPWQRAVR
jgi:hypothetical protein